MPRNRILQHRLVFTGTISYFHTQTLKTIVKTVYHSIFVKCAFVKSQIALLLNCYSNNYLFKFIFYTALNTFFSFFFFLIFLSFFLSSFFFFHAGRFNVVYFKFGRNKSNFKKCQGKIHNTKYKIQNIKCKVHKVVIEEKCILCRS